MGNQHWLKIYHIWWRYDLRGQFLMFEGWKYFCQAQVKNLVTILYQIYCYVYQIFQMNNIWVYWCVGPTVINMKINGAVQQRHLFSCLLLPIRPAITMLWIIMLCFSFFPLINYASPSLVYMYMLKWSTRRFLTYVEFAKAPYSSTLTHLHVYCSFLNFVRMKWMLWTGASLDTIGNTHIIIVSSNKILIMEVNSHMGVTLYKANSVWISSPGWRLVVSTIFP